MPDEKIVQELSKLKAKPGKAEEKRKRLEILRQTHIRICLYRSDFQTSGFTTKQSESEISFLEQSIEKQVSELKECLIF